MPSIKRIPLVSSNLKACGYEKETSTLFVEFQNGQVYGYSNVSEVVFNELVNAPSAGKFFQQNIRGRYSYESDVFRQPVDAPASVSDADGDNAQT